ncbi:hypothetical protein QUA42_26955 [Microcoleus sp. Pol11C2]
MARNYGKSESGPGKENNGECDGTAGTRGLGSAGRQSERDGDDIPNGITQTDSERVHRNQEGSNNSGAPHFGKILSQLRQLQRSHLAYVESHEERLRARLKAAQDHHGQVLDQMRNLELEILSLLGEGESETEGT